MSQVNKHNISKNTPFQENKEKKYALVVGVNTALHTPAMAPLKYAESDAQGLGWLLAREECNFAFPSAVLTGTEASTQAVRQAIVHLLAQRSHDDFLLFYFIGHSHSILTDDEEIETYLVTSDFDPKRAKHDPSAYLSLRWLRRMFLEQNETASIMLVLDCVYAGNIWDFAGTTLPEQSRRSWAVLTSSEANALAYEATNHRDEGHTHMTGLILDALSGREPAVLDSHGDVTVLSLYNYVQKHMAKPEQPQRYFGLWGSFTRSWILAHHPTQNPVITNAHDVTAFPTTQQFFDEMICSTASLADLDIEQIRTFLQQERVLLQDDYRAGSSEYAQIEALGLLQGERPSYAALLCFGHRPTQWITGAYTRCIYWRDTKRLSGWLDDRECRGSLLQQFTQALNFLQKHLNFSRLIERGGSYEQPEIPFRVLEEALANALVHREYVTEPGNMPRAEGVVVEIFHNRIEISSPGQSPVIIEALQEASEQHPGSHPRNPQIQRTFYLANYVERIGTGIERIQEGLREADLPQATILSNQRTQTLTIVIPRPVMLPEHISVSKLRPENPPPSASATTSVLPMTYSPASVPKSAPRVHLFSHLLLPLLVVVLIVGSVIEVGPGYM